MSQRRSNDAELDLELELDEAQDSAGLSPDSSILGNASDVVERYCHCPLCGGRLHFSHVTDFAINLTRENSSCPECGYETKSTHHRLQ